MPLTGKRPIPWDKASSIFRAVTHPVTAVFISASLDGAY